MQHPVDTGGDEVAWPLYRKSRHWQAAGESLHDDQAQGIGEAGKHEYIGPGELLDQFFPLQRAEKPARRITCPEVCQGGPVADYPFAAGQVQAQERLDVFFYRDPAEVDENRPLPSVCWFGQWPEQLGIDPPRPQRNPLDTVAVQFLAQGVRGHHGAQCGVVEPAHERVAPADGDKRQAQGHVLGKPGMKGGGEGSAPAAAPPARGHPQRPLGDDVDGVRSETLQLADQPTPGQHAEANFRVAGAGDAAPAGRSEESDFMTKGGQFPLHIGQDAHHPVDLGMPCVGNERDFHVASIAAPG